jgi:hypothetical protein
MRRLTLAVATLFFSLTSTFADETQSGNAKYLGTWKRTAGDHTLTFEIKPGVMHVVVAANGNTIEADVDYAITKDGVLFGRISKVIKRGADDGPSEGDLFSFKLALDKDRLLVSDLRGTGPNEDPGVKQLVEGDYEKQKGHN